MIRSQGAPPTEQTIPLGINATVNQAELIAILNSAQRIWDEGLPETKEIVFLSDSQVCLKALSLEGTKSKLVQECHKALNKLGQRKRVILLWVPGHSNVEGNERADALAKRGTLPIPTGPEPIIPIPAKSCSHLVENWFDKKWEEQWNSLEDCRQSRGHILRTPKEYAPITTLSRLQIRHLVTLYTGHGNLGHHLHKMQLKENSSCANCGHPDEDSDHFLLRCPKYKESREDILEIPKTKKDWKNLGIIQLSRFLEKTKRLSTIL